MQPLEGVQPSIVFARVRSRLKRKRMGWIFARRFVQRVRKLKKIKGLFFAYGNLGWL
jgi:hypothetical protein